MGLDMKTKKKLSEETAKRYCTAAKKQKTKILDEFIATTGYNRKYAIHVLKNSAYVKLTHFNNVARQSVQVITKTRKKRNYEKYYGQAVQQEVIRLWIFSMYLCAKRLVPFIRDNIDYFAQKFSYDEKLKAKLARISSATVGRILKPEIPKHSIRGISTTRPAKNLNKLIPIRTFFDWDERKPGFFEVDTVANCGISTQGQYICTLTLTDVHSGWTENRALLNKAHRWVKEAIEDVKEKLPFQMKGIDSDNGSEFKNTQLLQWCKSNEIIFTRSRSYKKNDNCFVEQKNDSVVRRIVGYYRFEGEAARAVMADLYEQYNKLVNFFFPSMKIISKQRIDAKVVKKYDTAKTPYRRLMESSDVSEAVKAELCRRKNNLDLQQLLETTQCLQSKLISMAQPWT
ncbi:transposase [Treponema medium]|uniref:integrase catalytic domain-containing protein n=2 Tax=Treponema medium TaxID=58231 RepID=UPI00197FC5EE|nr:DDE-type integrase/transposase/recombinase [Treponema medium]QSH91737.1 transposase [Treponema medium]QSH92266.1 transposase [Treponema medium]QSH92404.1 transposase [Treponema medium]QSH92497.1 transposase [Treponema medium]QSH92597.1 transposase [Treponema medium]